MGWCGLKGVTYRTYNKSDKSYKLFLYKSDKFNKSPDKSPDKWYICDRKL